MKNQTYRMTMLFDFYGELLTDRQKEFLISIIMRTSPCLRLPKTKAFPVRASGM